MDNNSQTIDFTSLYSVANNDEEFIKELIEIFLAQIPDFIQNMNQLFLDNNLEKLGREAHTAKSSVMVFGMINTGKLLNQIEIWAESKNLDEIEPALKIVERDLELAKNELNEALKAEKFKIQNND
jgi:HPt (histidine-containing phosphotransfer) domain-containing protein